MKLTSCTTLVQYGTNVVATTCLANSLCVVGELVHAKSVRKCPRSCKIRALKRAIFNDELYITVLHLLLGLLWTLVQLNRDMPDRRIA